MADDIHIHVHLDGLVGDAFTEIKQLIETKAGEMAQSIQELQDAVAAEDTVIDGVVTLLQGVAAQIAAAGVDPVALAAVVADVNTHASALAAAAAAVPPTP